MMRNHDKTPLKNFLSNVLTDEDGYFEQERQVKVAVVGAAGGIGRSLAMLLKFNDNINNISLYDVAPTEGIANDLGNIYTQGNVAGFTGGNDGLEAALEGADIVVVPAGVPRKPGMTRDDLFNTNAGIVADIAKAVGNVAPEALLCIISNPVNSTVPVAREVLKKLQVYDQRKLFGVTTLDVQRAHTFFAESQGQRPTLSPVSFAPQTFNIPVIGGHAGNTILPLLSELAVNFTDEERDALTQRIMFGGDEVVQAKGGAGSATLSMAYAASHFTNQAVRALAGAHMVRECAYVDTACDDDDGSDLPDFFAMPVQIGRNGVSQKVRRFNTDAFHPYELEAYNKMLPDLRAQIQKGIEFGQAYSL
jgi:malate dehydrogenase